MKREDLLYLTVLSLFASPLDPVHTSKYRIVYLVAYGAVAGTVVNLVINQLSLNPTDIKFVWVPSE